jgi:hypothetical protein
MNLFSHSNLPMTLVVGLIIFAWLSFISVAVSSLF